ncbi:hypothetical protein EBN03_05910 [Nocardia stercoris]|uniref:SalK n=2 Tax=Nocardia stercoris TaxID=2483361 RepID=A0A3M2LI02_9NOCA|nr:hypothetical protein EBN03_05910 [Nocardia stercoris]
MWRVLEPLHSVTYFEPGCIAANKDAGLRGYWMGYFAARSAPLGAAGPELVTATFFNFSPAMVARALPDAWGFADPDTVLEVRQRAAAAALRAMAPEIAAAADAALPALRAAVASAPSGGRPLFAANREVANPADPVEELWQALTALREHRGDGHVAALVAAGLDGIEALVLFAADTGSGPEVWLPIRGWSESDWAAAQSRLAERALLDTDGAVTPAGKALREHIEARTDALAATAYRDIAGIDAALTALTPAARSVTATKVVKSPIFLATGKP